LTPQGNKPKLASGQKSIYTRKRVFVHPPLAAESPRKSPPSYDELVSGGTVYAYTNGNPIGEIDPLGLSGFDRLPGYGITSTEAQALSLQQMMAAAQSQIATTALNSALPMSAGATWTVPTGQYDGIPTAVVLRFKHSSNETSCSIGWGARTGPGNFSAFRPSAAYSAKSYGKTTGLGWTVSLSTPGIVGPAGYSSTTTYFFNGAYSSAQGPAAVSGQTSGSIVLSYTVAW